MRKRKLFGMRAIKTALVVVITLLISDLFELKAGSFAVIAAIILIQNTLSDTFITGRNRIIGTAFGGLVGIVSYWIAPQSFIIAALGSIFIIFFFNEIRMSGAITTAIILYVSIQESDVSNIYWFTWDRVWATSIGIIVATLINIYIAPPNFMKRLEFLLSECEYYEKTVFIEHVMYETTIDVDELSDRIEDLHSFFLKYQEDRKILKASYLSLQKEIKVVDVAKKIDLLVKISHHLRILSELEETCSLSLENYVLLCQQYKYVLQQRSMIPKLTNKEIIFNYHVNQILMLFHHVDTITIEESNVIDEFISE